MIESHTAVLIKANNRKHFSCINMTGMAQRDEDEAVRQHAARELEVNDLQQRLASARSHSGSSRAATLQAQVDSTEAQLAEARAALAEATARHDALAAERRDTDRQLQALYQKQGAGAQFATQAERDAWLKGEIATLRGALEDSNRAARDAEGRRGALEAELQGIQQVWLLPCRLVVVDLLLWHSCVHANVDARCMSHDSTTKCSTAAPHA